jgi:uncharacterized Zn-binding protein involved in type VI secretion
MFPAARIGDPVTHDMLVPSGVIIPAMTPPTGGPVLIEGLPAAYVTCMTACSGAISLGIAHPPIPGPQPPIVKGSLTVHIYNLPAARWMPSLDVSACGVFLGDPKLAAMRTVLIGDVGTANPGTPAAAFQKAAESGAALVCKGPCEACGQL